MGRLQEYLKYVQPNIVDEIISAQHSFFLGDPIAFTNILQSYYQKRPFQTALQTSESTFQVAIETLWFDEPNCISDLSLLVHPSKEIYHGRHGRLGIFLISPTRPASAAVELKNCTLSGLWMANHQTSKGPSWDEVKELRKVLEKETEEQLLRRRYSYYDKTARSQQTLSLQVVKDEAVNQAKTHFQAIKGGTANGSKAGILDERVRCIDGQSDLYGYVMLCIGDTRVLTWRVSFEKANQIFGFPTVEHYLA